MLIISKKNKQGIRDALTADGITKQDHYARMVMIPQNEIMKAGGYFVLVDIDCFHCKGSGWDKTRHNPKDKVNCGCIRTMKSNLPIRYLKIAKAPGMDHKHTMRGN